MLCLCGKAVSVFSSFSRVRSSAIHRTPPHSGCSKSDTKGDQEGDRGRGEGMSTVHVASLEYPQEIRAEWQRQISRKSQSWLFDDFVADFLREPREELTDQVEMREQEDGPGGITKTSQIVGYWYWERNGDGEFELHAGEPAWEIAMREGRLGLEVGGFRIYGPRIGYDFDIRHPCL